MGGNDKHSLSGHVLNRNLLLPVDAVHVNLRPSSYSLTIANDWKSGVMVRLDAGLHLADGDSPQLVDVVNIRHPQTFLNQLDSGSQHLEGLGMGGNDKYSLSRSCQVERNSP